MIDPMNSVLEGRQLPLGTLFKASSLEVGLAMTGTYSRALREHGMVAVELGFQDPASQFVLDLVDAVDKTWEAALIPKREGRADFRARSNAFFSVEGVNTAAAVALNQNMRQNFGTKPDREPVQIFGFHVLRPQDASNTMFRMLKSNEVFGEDASSSVGGPSPQSHVHMGPLAVLDEQTRANSVWQRKNTLFDPLFGTDKVNNAVQALAMQLEHTDCCRGTAPSIVKSALKGNMILLVKNARFMHGQ